MAKKLQNYLLIAGSVAGGLATKFYEGPHESLVKGYGWDVIIPVYIYNLYNIENDYLKAGVVFAGCSALEIAQHFGLYHGTFDPKDFIAYGVGTALALGIDKLAKRFSRIRTIGTVVD